jgi:hypothetical protein
MKWCCKNQQSAQNLNALVSEDETEEVMIGKLFFKIELFALEIIKKYQESLGNISNLLKSLIRSKINS